jgi:ABC-type bacteriocin/lantibiotic exporter with double-glycine peptidase domain
MVSLSVGGSLVGLVPPVALGRLVDAVVHGGAPSRAGLWAVAIGVAVVAQAAAYVLSDGLYARIASRLYCDLRELMFDGILRRRLKGSEAAAFASRFVSDAEGIEHLTVGVLDQGAVSLGDLGVSIIALAVFGGWIAAVAAVGVLAASVAMRRLQRPAAAAGERRQEALEEMIHELGQTEERDAVRRRTGFRESLDELARREQRLGWIAAANRHGSLAVAGLGPVVVLMVAALETRATAGVLLTVYLLAARAFEAAETLLDLALEIEVARGAARRCFSLVFPMGTVAV